MRTFDFTQVDVFTSRKLEGNPLAVFHSGAGLSGRRMQAIAREMNLSETTFIFPAGKDADARVRIFTVREELPFAGHPTLGTAFVLAQARPGQSEIRLQMKAGIIPVTVARKAGAMYLEMRQNDPLFGARLTDARRLAEALGIRVSELDSRYPPQAVSTGLPFLILPLRHAESLARLAPNPRLLQPLLRKVGAHFPYYLVTGEEEIEARMFDATFEDPATGSAAGCATAYLVLYGHRRPDTSVTIRQGRFVARPSLIFAAASLTDGRAHNVRVGGHVVEVLQGRLRL
jgi:trans-2,3-dihydro-3-hydroxyanthranilate isomerase